MIATEANKWIAQIHGAPDILLDEIPRIAGTIELDVAMIDKSAFGTKIDARFAPDAVPIGVQFAPDKRGRFCGALAASPMVRALLSELAKTS
jgi:hypothetical protein